MNNPELISNSPRTHMSNSVNLTARTMFDYDTHRNIPWNFV
jgi:hypothetical protein